VQKFRRQEFIFKVRSSSVFGDYSCPLLPAVLDCAHYIRNKDPKYAPERETGEIFSLDPLWKELMPSFKILGKEDVPPGFDTGYGYRSMCINVPIYLGWLVGQCRKQGVVFKRAVLSHIADAATLHQSGKADVVVNCTGLLASKLGGVMDANIVPVRGQTVLVRNDSGMIISTSGNDDGPEESCYMMPRAAGGGTLIGGLHQVGNWESQPDPDIALRMVQRAVKVCPALTNGKGIEALSIISYNVGLRPLRHGGVRIERENIEGVEVVHNYGHAGRGYQYSYGTSEEAIGLVGEIVGKK
jgi:D-amino-acid oxidase